MAELTVLSYHCGKSMLHQLDVRFKLFSLVLVSLTVIQADHAALFIISLMLITVLLYIRFPLRSSLMDLRYFFILMILIFFARAFSTTGSALVEWRFIVLSQQGVYEAAMVCWRLLLVVFFSLSFVLSTRPSEIKAAVEWFLLPFPFIPRKRIAVMMSLILRFMPVIYTQVKDTADAQRARGIEARKNPLFRLIKLLIPVIRRTFDGADDLALAMEARCFSEHRTDPVLSASGKDWVALFIIVCLCSVAVVL
ncbi:MAG: energy-coupling factor transporter transmembrane component T [Thermodesulfobacteriota bacterium]|nr:energy-coupling factor transporter transmembrane component T [Thermodesulfobacteriota bacterium]